MNLPTKITLVRLIGCIVLFIGIVVLDIISKINNAFVSPYLELGNVKIDIIFIILFVIFLFSSLSDIVDGYLARKRNEVTNLGKFLDPVADKLLVNMMLVFLSCVPLVASYNQVQNVGIPVWCTIIMILRDIVVDALRFIAADRKVVIAANVFGKLKTIFQMIAIAIILINDFPFAFFDQGFLPGLRISDFLVYIATLASVISGIIYVVQNKNVLKENNKND